MIPLSVHYADPFRGKIKYSWRRKGEICSPSFLFTRDGGLVGEHKLGKDWKATGCESGSRQTLAYCRRYFRLEPVSYEDIGGVYTRGFASPNRGRGGRMGSSLSVGNTADINSGSVELYSRLNGGKDVELCGSRCVSIYFKELPLFVLSEKCSSRVKLMYEGEEGRRKLLSRSIFDILPLLRLILYEWNV